MICTAASDDGDHNIAMGAAMGGADVSGANNIAIGKFSDALTSGACNMIGEHALGAQQWFIILQSVNLRE